MNKLTLKYLKSKSNRSFYEYYIDDIPLSKRLDEFYNNQTTLLNDWVGKLGSFENKAAEIVEIKQLLLKDISEVEVENIFPKMLETPWLKFEDGTQAPPYKEEIEMIKSDNFVDWRPKNIIVK